MKTVILYRPNSEHARPVDEFVHEFTRRYGNVHVELLNVDSREGGATAVMYDITSYPAVLALRDDGSTAMMWQGTQGLPLLDDVIGYMH